MNTYIVNVRFGGTVQFEVEAENSDLAAEFAEEAFASQLSAEEIGQNMANYFAEEIYEEESV